MLIFTSFILIIKILIRSIYLFFLNNFFNKIEVLKIKINYTTIKLFFFIMKYKKIIFNILIFFHLII